MKKNRHCFLKTKIVVLTELFFNGFSINSLIFAPEIRRIFCVSFELKFKYCWAGFCASKSYCILFFKWVTLLYLCLSRWLLFAVAFVQRLHVIVLAGGCDQQELWRLDIEPQTRDVCGSGTFADLILRCFKPTVMYFYSDKIHAAPAAVLCIYAPT